MFHIRTRRALALSLGWCSHRCWISVDAGFESFEDYVLRTCVRRNGLSTAEPTDGLIAQQHHQVVAQKVGNRRSEGWDPIATPFFSTKSLCALAPQSLSRCD